MGRRYGSTDDRHDRSDDKRSSMPHGWTVYRTPPTAGALAVDGDGDGAPAPTAGPGRRREPEVDDATLDRVANVSCQPRAVSGHVQLGSERDQLWIDGD